METKTTHIANFNCTFDLLGKVFPMLDYFESLLLPAVTENSFVRKSKTGEFYLADVKLIDLSLNQDEKELALIGLHVKKVNLDIRHDYNPVTGFIHIGEKRPSAPFSTFILLLRNHRLIHYRDQAGSPNARGLAATFEKAIKEYRKNFIKYVLDSYDDGNDLDIPILGVISKDRFPQKKDLRSHIIRSVPVPTINIVPIPHPNIVEQKLKEFSRIEELTFRVFALNSELQVNDVLRQFSELSELMKTSTAGGTFKNPSNIEKVTEFVQESKGLADLQMKAYIGKNKITMSPDDFVENIYVDIPTDRELFAQAQKVYSELKNKEEIETTSNENLEHYKDYVSKY